MSVSGLSPRPHASSFSTCSAASRRRASAQHAAAGTASSSLATCSSANYNSILLGQCSIKPEKQLFYQAKKPKDTGKEALQAKLEDYKQQCEQMEVRAIAAEAEVTSLKLEKNSLEDQLKQFEGTINSLKRSSAKKGESLERFQQKLGHIRVAMTKEVDKLRKKEKDLKLAFDSVMRCVLEYRTDAISKDDFLITVDLISSTLVDSGSYSPISGQLHQTVFCSSEREKLSALPHKLRRSRLQELMGMISDQEIGGATSDDDLLKGEVELGTIDHSPSPPPLPPRTKSTSSIKVEDLNKAEEMLKRVQEQQERLREEEEEEGDSVVDVASSSKPLESPKSKPRVVPRKSKLTKSSSSSLEAAPAVNRSLKPNIPKPLKSPRKKQRHVNNTLRQMYGGQDRGSSASGTPTSASKNTPGFFTFQGKYPPAGSFMEDSDSNSSDFEEFVPPQRRKFTSESQVPIFPPTGSLPIHIPLDRRGSSPFPSSRPQSKEYQPIKKSSPILTRRPTWFTRKTTSPALLESIESPIDEKTTPTTSGKVQIRSGGKDRQSKVMRKKKGRSRSLDTRSHNSVSTSGNTYSLLDLHAVGMDSDENTGGTVDSSGYARPFEHINSWRKLIGMDDGSAFSGSLPHLADNVSSAINNTNNDDDSDTCTYLDPREIAQKLDKNMPQKVRKRLDTVLSNTYLQLISVQPPQFAELPPIQPPSVIAATPVEPSNSKQLSGGEASFKEKWENRSLDFIERPDSCLSGYTSDALSNASSGDADRSEPETEEGELDEKTMNPYDEIRTGSNNSYSTAAEALRNRFDDIVYSSSAPVEHGGGGGRGEGGEGGEGEGVYSVIDELLLNNRGGMEISSPSSSLTLGARDKKISSVANTTDDTSMTPPLPKPRVKKTPVYSKQDSGLYARLDETGVQGSSNLDIPLEVIRDTCSDCRRPPTPPPRRHRNTSTVTKGSEYDDGMGNGKRLNIPGIGPPPMYISLKRGEHLRLFPLSATASPNVSSDEHNLSDGGELCNEHLYSLGRFLPTNKQPGGGASSDLGSTTATSTATLQSIPNHSPPENGRHRVSSSGSSAVTLPKRRRVTHSTATSNLLMESYERGDSLASAEDAPGRSSPAVAPSAPTHGTAAALEGSGSHKPLSPQRSNTFSAPKSTLHQQVASEKKGYLNKMGPDNKKRFTRRWFVLNGSELKYYRSHKDMKRPRGIIKLDSWCKLTKLKSQEAFELATPQRTFQLAAKNAIECSEWLKVLEEAMQFSTCVTKNTTPLKPQSPTISGWAQVTKNGRSERLWCELDHDMLNMCPKPGVEPSRRISVSQSSVRKKRDSILLDSNYSRSNLKAMLFSIKERESGGITTIAPDAPEDKEKWFYHLSATQGGDQLELTVTEKVLSQIMQDQAVNPRDNSNWKHPVLNWTSGRLHQPLTSLPSSALNAEAKNLFQHLQLYLSTPMKPMAFEHHLCSVQHLIDSCLKHSALQDELYCQLLRQISGHASMTAHQVLQGWFLLYLMIHMFLPLKVKFNWYLQMFLDRHIASSNITISNFALECNAAVKRAQQDGRRQCKPSYYELSHLLGRFAGTPTSLDATLTLHVNLPDSTQREVELTPSTTVLDFTARLNTLINMPDTLMTGFALMCDWPGVHEASCCCPFPESKVCDIISMWSSSLEELNYSPSTSHVQAKQQRRDIMFTYQRRLAFQKHQGLETEMESVLLAYQISTNVLSGHHPVSSIEGGLHMAAIMAQIEYGDWSSVEKTEDSEYTARDVLQRFCPWKFTHMALEHDQSQLQKKLVDQWKEQNGKSKDECSKIYLELAQQWKYYGATLFKAEEIFCSDRAHRAIWLAVHEGGVSLLNSSTMGTISSYSYGEISTFGGSRDSEFIMVVSPHEKAEDEQQRVNRGGGGGTLNRNATSGAGGASGAGGGGVVKTEKLVFTMPKLQVCEVTFLIANYMEAYEGPKMNAYDI